MITKSEVVILLERIAEELKHEEDRQVLLKYADKIKRAAYAEIIAELLG